MILTRFPEYLGGTPGIIIHNNTVWSHTLELPWKDNQHSISCIPKGTYNISWKYSQHFQKFTYELLNVPDRAGIRIHSANMVNQLEGCIACGNSYVFNKNPDSLFITESTLARRALENFIGQNNITTITVD